MSRPHETTKALVARLVRTAIEAGRPGYRAGEKLPTTRALAIEWETSVYTITEAMKELAAEGLIGNRDRSSRIVVGIPDSRSRLVTIQPHALMIGGYAGSGKSELGKIIARKTHWAIVDKDTITRPVVESALTLIGKSPHDRESEDYLKQVRPYEYEALAYATTENIECGNSVITTAPFIREFLDEAWMQRNLSSNTQLGAHTVVVWVYCDLASMHKYIRQRGAARDATKLADWERYTSSLNLNFRPQGEHVVIDNSTGARPLPQQADDLLKEILRREAGK